LGNFQFVNLTIQNAGQFTISANTLNQSTLTNPDIYFYSAGRLSYQAKSTQVNTESLSLFLLPGDYTLAVAEVDLLDAAESRDITHCFQLVLSEGQES
jgi:hypothetical protein